MKLNKLIDFGRKLIMKKFAVWMDGGTLTILCSNEIGEEFNIEFVQNVVFGGRGQELLPGRIYINNRLVSIRSETEKRLLKKLNNVDTTHLGDLERRILNEKIDYCLSEKYISDSQKLI